MNIALQREQERAEAASEDATLVKLAQTSVGYFGWFVAILIFVSIVMTLLDKSYHSCGAQCRYLVRLIWYWTPIDIILLSSRDFYSDTILLSLLYMFCIASSLTAIKEKGFSIMGWNIVSIGNKRTTSQGLIIATGLLILGNFAWIYQTTLLAPQYMSYGTQKYCTRITPQGRICTDTPELVFSCQLTSPIDQCIPTVLSTIFARINFVLPWFGTLLYYESYMFCCAFLMGIVSSMLPPKKQKEDNEPLLE
jgi:hypothetical protein